jgi:hypothetical protein
MKYYLDNISDGYHKGWLEVNLINGENIELPFGVLLERISTARKHELARVLEGNYKNSIVQLPYNKLGNTNTSFLSEVTTNCKKLSVVLDISSKELIINELKYSVIFDPNYLISDNYDILTPDFRHSSKSRTEYIDEKRGGSRFAESWFKLISSSDNINNSMYLHYGKYSNGCITFSHDQGGNSWSKIVSSFSRSRYSPGIIAKLNIKY